MKKLYLLFPALLYLFVSSAQNFSFELGLKATSEFAASQNDGYALGIETLFHIDKNSSIGAGVSYKSNPKKYLALIGLSPQSRPIISPFSQTEKTVLLPIFYRLNTRIISVSAGAGLNILINKNQLQEIAGIEKDDWKNNTSEILTSFSVSKSFRLNKTLYVEPEIKQCFYSNGGGRGLQINLSLRKRFVSI